MDLNGRCYCEECRGKGFTEDKVVLNFICNRCKGNGSRDWVEQARGVWGNFNHRLHEKSIRNNIETLRYEMIRQYRILGMDVEIEVHRHPDDFNKIRRRPSLVDFKSFL